MRIQLNGQERQVPDGTTLAELLAELDLPGEGVAVAVDRAVIPRGDHAEHRLTEGAEVEVIRAVGGG